jgi:D-ribulokinase
MQLPKLLWLKQHVPATYAGAVHFFDLADFLSFRATGSTARSLCTLTCKWTYLAHEGRWHDAFLARIGLAELCRDRHARIGAEVVAPGAPVGRGLDTRAADELGLVAGTPVGGSLIDAHAGGIGTIGGRCARDLPQDALRRFAYIMGTSACIMASTREPRFVPGIWGPYYSGMVPGLWLNEGGQSAAGAAIDHLVASHPAHAALAAAAKGCGDQVLELLERRALARAPDPSEAALIARNLHVLPDFLGNRSPRADPEARAVIAGLDLDADAESLERIYVAGLCGLAYGLADVIDALQAHAVPCGMLVISGGASHSRLVRQIMADTTGLPVAPAQTSEPVLLGAAMLGAVAAEAFASIPDAMRAMSALGEATHPGPQAMREFHRAKRRVHTLMQTLDAQSRAAMQAVATI